jgi:hypothetical protein
MGKGAIPTGEIFHEHPQNHGLRSQILKTWFIIMDYPKLFKLSKFKP